MVTVIVPSYNHERFLIECLESIYNQTFKEFQWIVVDDGSKDSSPQILQENQKKYNYTLILQQNIGLANTLNHVIKEFASGVYIAICASDDYWLPDKLMKQVNYMINNVDVAMCYGRTYYVDTKSKVLDIKQNHKYRGGDIFEDIILQRFHPPVNYLIKKNIIEDVGYYKPNVIGEDFYMNCFIALKYKIGFINEYLGFYRVADIGLKRDPYNSFADIRHTIDMFNFHPIYREAVRRSNNRSAIALAGYRKYKFFSIKFAILSIREFTLITLFKYIRILVFTWKASAN